MNFSIGQGCWLSFNNDRSLYKAAWRVQKVKFKHRLVSASTSASIHLQFFTRFKLIAPQTINYCHFHNWPLRKKLTIKQLTVKLDRLRTQLWRFKWKRVLCFPTIQVHFHSVFLPPCIVCSVQRLNWFNLFLSLFIWLIKKLLAANCGRWKKGFIVKVWFPIKSFNGF